MNKIILAALAIVILIGGYSYYGKDKADTASAVKEFSMISRMDINGEVMSPTFSLNEMRVKKGDTVKITVTNTNGMHDFVLDEFGIAKETPLNEPVVIEFVADKVGTFEYYCSKYNHRALGQRGNLIVE